MVFVRVCLAVLLLLAAADAQARWLVAETAHFRIHGELGESRIREEAAVLEDFHALLELLTKRTFPPESPKLDIYLVEDRGALRLLNPRLPERVAGFYTASRGGIFAVSLEPSGANREFGRDVLLHEYAHHFMMQAGNAALPAWYVEGFAEYLMTAEFRPDRIDFGGLSRGRYYVLTNMAWAPLEQVLARAPSVSQDNFYAQSWLLTHYLSRVEGMPAKRDAYLRKVAAGADPVQAFKDEIDPDLQAFQGRLRNYLSGRSFTFSRLKRKAPQEIEVQVMQLSPVADKALLPLVAVQLPRPPAERAEHLARIRAEVAKAPDDAWGARALAIADVAAGLETVGPDRLDALLLTAPTDPALLRWRARIYRADRPTAAPTDVTEARKLLVRANRASPDDWQVLSDYAATFEARGAPLSESVLAVLAKANALAPQEPTLAWRTAIAQARAGNYSEAEAVLAPLVNNPHARRAMTLERTLLEALRGRQKGEVEAALAGLRVARGQPDPD
jgi:Flp pilus assembly protein TadD